MRVIFWTGLLAVLAIAAAWDWQRPGSVLRLAYRDLSVRSAPDKSVDRPDPALYRSACEAEVLPETVTITKHQLDGVVYCKSPNFYSGIRMKPDAIVLHDTASRLNYRGSVSWFRNPEARVSAHLVIGRDGEVAQLVPFDRIAIHAGISSFAGRRNLNFYSIGIELVNPGKLTKIDQNFAKPWFDGQYEIAEFGIKPASSPAHGTGLWMPYTKAQLSALEAIIKALRTNYHIEADKITGHWVIAPGRKIDPNPLFPWEQVISASEPTSL